ncbi:rod shape-determining protein MreC [Clostridium sp. MSJ-11]|uniref:Cell shape-determining protein MreC n=1 Tax=Clostridium mobile TaxID=2841512 RepID=A0ABS6EED1_9CLOT|nr:rod shape-determining protein MreC [Clostridium mobile]MBU5483571.1 rod shape-determining protein MreC [Clostridium mobile]
MGFLKNKLAVAIVVLSVTFLVLIGYSAKREKVSFVENGVGVAVNPIQGLFYKINTKAKNFTEFVTSFSDVKNENEELKKRNTELESKEKDYDVLKEENERLRGMLKFKDQNSEYDYIGCDIVGRSGGNFLEEFTINKGKKDGIEKQMAVITEDGLVGQIGSVGDNWAKVQTLSNENIAVTSIVQSTRESVGVTKGYKDGRNKKLAKTYYLPLESEIKVGDSILTSGTGIYPKGIRIGKVIDVEEDKGKVMKNAIIQPFVDFSKLEEVLVVVPKNKLNIR